MALGAYAGDRMCDFWVNAQTPVPQLLLYLV